MVLPLFRDVDVDVFLNAVHGSLVVPSLNGEDVSTVGGVGDFLLQVGIAGRGDERVVDRLSSR
jgi:hypothetical protein